MLKNRNFPNIRQIYTKYINKRQVCQNFSFQHTIEREKMKDERAKLRLRREQREFTLYAEPKQLKDREAGLKMKILNSKF